MPCGPTCACLSEPGLECLSVLDPLRWGHFREMCAGADPAQRNYVVVRSRIGIAPPPRDPALPLGESIRLHNLMRLCPWRGHASCECAGLYSCAVGNGRRGMVTHQDCLACLKNEKPK